MTLRKNPVFVLMAIVCVIFWAPWSLSANIFSANGIDPRSYVTQNDSLWRVLLPVGTITADFSLRNKDGIGDVKPGMGTAFMVSPCYAMTNYHVLFGDNDFALNPMSDYPVTLEFEPTSNRKARQSVKGQVRYWGSANSSGPDIALVRLDGCPGMKLGWYDLIAMTDGRQQFATTLAMPSFSLDRSMTRLSLQQGCSARAYVPRRGWLLHDCATREGASGAPLVANLSGVPIVVGINAGEFRAARGVRNNYDLRHANWAVSAIEISKEPRLKAILQQDLHMARSANPLLSISG